MKKLIIVFLDIVVQQVWRYLVPPCQIGCTANHFLILLKLSRVVGTILMKLSIYSMYFMLMSDKLLPTTDIHPLQELNSFCYF